MTPVTLGDASTVSVAVWLAPPKLAVIVAVVVGGTLVVVMVKAWDVAPAGTITVAGTIASGLLLVKATGTPPAGAGIGSVMVPVTGSPPGTELTATDSASGPIVSAAVLLTPK